MEGTLDPFDFQLAEALHKTLTEVGAMSMREHVAWRAYFVWSNAQRELEAKEIKPERTGRG